LIEDVSSKQLRKAFNEAAKVLANTGAPGNYYEAYWHVKFKEVAAEYGISALHCIGDSTEGSIAKFNVKNQY
jgi:hypothetical protein